MCSFFFFQAEDGIRDYKVTGVQTCALPIYLRGDAGGPRRLGVREPSFLRGAGPSGTEQLGLPRVPLYAGGNRARAPGVTRCALPLRLLDDLEVDGLDVRPDAVAIAAERVLGEAGLVLRRE